MSLVNKITVGDLVIAAITLTTSYYVSWWCGVAVGVYSGLLMGVMKRMTIMECRYIEMANVIKNAHSLTVMQGKLIIAQEAKINEMKTKVKSLIEVSSH